ncbi:hypothetical protein BVRB_4g085150 isoform C [Beta vulgaris subsp. vulgaris]|nr:hypothetical protein BVRB_4g085150 isoform C [Beta vulgaris subsp. vulgaris]
MTPSLLKSMFLFLAIKCFSTSSFRNIGSNAQLIPQSEVETLNIISRKLENTFWHEINQTSCINVNQSFNRYYDNKANLSNVTCDCSFNSGVVCHVTHM